MLFAGIERCGMCGWPAGVGYPPADGELETAASSAPSPETDVADDGADHVGGQLDALAGMVARQGQPLASEGATVESPEATDSPEAAAVAEEDADEVKAPEAPTPAVEVSDKAEESDTADADSEVDAEEADAELDPLTAPLTALTGTSDRTEPTLLEPVLEPEAPSIDANVAPASQDVMVDEFSAPADEIAGPVTTQTAGRAAALLRPAQLLIVGTAALNLVLVGLDAVLGTATGVMTMVVLGLALITLAVWTGAAVTFLHWVSRAHTHVAATASAPQRHGASMSLIGWFIPVAGFVIGYRVLQDLWTGSDPATRDDADAAPAKVRMIDVWLLGIVTAALFGYAMPFALGESALWGAASGIGLLVAALSLVSVMGAISTWQATSADAAVDVGSNEAETEDGIETSPSDEPVESATAPEPVSVSAE